MKIPSRTFVVHSVGIFICYFMYGIMQETLTRGRYGEQVQEDGSVGERFTLSLSLVWIQCFTSFWFAKLVLNVRPQWRDKTSTRSYVVCSISYLSAMVLSCISMRWIYYPIAIVGKSAKPMAVMILGAMIGRKSYSITRYACVGFIILGVFLFVHGEENEEMEPGKHAFMGQLCLVLSLLLDGFTGVMQEHIRVVSGPTGVQMMKSINYWSTVILGVLIILTGEAKALVYFFIQHPQVRIHLLLFAVSGVLGQFFVFLMVANFGSLACAIVTTTRKFITVVYSVIFLGNVLGFNQWLGAIVVFAALFIDMFFG
ncbi:hypothetical protein KR018_003119, partial [Drosophila ironensis]